MCNDQRVATCNKRKEIKTYRKKSPNQHASFLEHIATIEFYLPHTDIQAAFDQFSSKITFILNDHLLFLPVIQTTTQVLRQSLEQCLQIYSRKLKYDLETWCSVNGLKSNLQASCGQCLVCRDWLVSGGALSVGQYQRLY